MTINPTTELEKELLAALGEQVLKVRKLEKTVESQNELIKNLPALGGNPRSENAVFTKERASKVFPAIDPLATGPRHVV